MQHNKLSVCQTVYLIYHMLLNEFKIKLFFSGHDDFLIFKINIVHLLLITMTFDTGTGNFFLKLEWVLLGSCTLFTITTLNCEFYPQWTNQNFTFGIHPHMAEMKKKI